MSECICNPAEFCKCGNRYNNQLSGVAINAKHQAEQAYFRALRENWEKHTWNAAIEAAAKCAELNNNECRVDVLIRKLKK